MLWYLNPLYAKIIDNTESKEGVKPYFCALKECITVKNNGSLHIMILSALIIVVTFSWASVRVAAQDIQIYLPLWTKVVGFPEDVLQQYAEAFNVSLEEAAYRLRLQGEMDILERQVIDNEPTYAGSWTVHQPEFGIVIALASPNAEEILDEYLQGIAWADLVSIQEAPRTLDELREILNIVNEAAVRTGIRFSSGSNIQGSKITLYTSEPEALRTALEADESAQPYLADIEYADEIVVVPGNLD